jgi:hypothetical protein
MLEETDRPAKYILAIPPTDDLCVATMRVHGFWDSINFYDIRSWVSFRPIYANGVVEKDFYIATCRDDREYAKPKDSEYLKKYAVNAIKSKKKIDEGKRVSYTVTLFKVKSSINRIIEDKEIIRKNNDMILAMSNNKIGLINIRNLAFPTDDIDQGGGNELVFDMNLCNGQIPLHFIYTPLTLRSKEKIEMALYNCFLPAEDQMWFKT